MSLFGKIATIGGISMVIAIILSFIGFVANIVQLIIALVALESLSLMSGLILVKFIGIFVAPLGAIMGLVGMF